MSTNSAMSSSRSNGRRTRPGTCVCVSCATLFAVTTLSRAVMSLPPSIRQVALSRSTSPVFRFHVPADGLADDLPTPSLLGASERIDAALEVAGFALQLPPRLEPIRGETTARNRGKHGAARFTLVTAVREPALAR